uniref:FAM65 N-terminal domain-containing protein n=1 Tax=Oncorhynchus mykiss TaxID=8022 RepID=A0A8C7UXX1_ONCMY
MSWIRWVSITPGKMTVLIHNSINKPIEYVHFGQVKAIERFMRRLEFHLSKVEELYDAYCMQRRLRDGASKMVAAFNSATGSKEARESLNEANRGYREYTEHMCSLESELENQMGEFHIKMKGLVGYARLCAGDQYEVLMRYGRQRWRMKGRVEVSSKQVWDSEDNVFLPLITELLSIKVTELKSLANHVVVGSVSCETLDLFCPLPQTVAVDINDLGTVKLNLEVNWRSVSPQSSLFTTSPCLTFLHLNPCSTFIYLPILLVIAKPGHL